MIAPLRRYDAIDGSASLFVIYRGGVFHIEVGHDLDPSLHRDAGATLLQSDRGERFFRTVAEVEEKLARFMGDNPHRTAVVIEVPAYDPLPQREVSEEERINNLLPNERVRAAFWATVKAEGVEPGELFEMANMVRTDRGLSWPKAIPSAVSAVRWLKRSR
ncbi:MAG: hypothetical protein JNK72_24840 [Myxococcales bacterium]|nr:hypothetical protein [Myxococcales bacterium]